MRKNKAKYLMGSAIIIAASQISATSAIQESDNQWLLIDERITGEIKNLSSQLTFADRNSLSGSAEEPSLSVSSLNFGEEKIDGRLQLMIIDSRMKVMINCEEQNYKLLSIEQYDQDNIKIETASDTLQIGQWQRAQTPSYSALITFACNPDDGDYSQTFGPKVQPLQGLIGYLNADWSK